MVARFHVVIPARFGASRLPGKPLADLGGKPLIQWVWEAARASGAESVVVATDDERILRAVTAFHADCQLTLSTHASGTDRIAEVAKARGWKDEDLVVNVQGDEPLMPPAVIAAVAQALADHPQMDIATAIAPIQSLEEFIDPSCVKALCAADGSALYFSRAPVPFPRDESPDGIPRSHEAAWRHIGIYAYRVRSLLRFASWPPTLLEMREKLEQLRALENGMKVYAVKLAVPPPAGVDTALDLARVRGVIYRTVRNSQ